MAVKVYGSPISPFVARAMLALEEKGVAYELVPVDVVAGEHKRPPHTNRNPFGQVPAFEDGDLTLFESRAISKYIARKHKNTGDDLLRCNKEEEAALVEVWMEVEAHQYNPVISPIIQQLLVVPFFGGKPDEAIIATNVEKLEKVLDVYEARLSQTKYLAGDFFSLADLHHVPYTYYLTATPHASLMNSRPHVKAWWEDLAARPAVKNVTNVMMAAVDAAGTNSKQGD